MLAEGILGLGLHHHPVLAGVQDVAPMPVTVITNSINRGFPAAVNQGLSIVRGNYLVLLNNDSVVTDGWLDQLIALADMKTDSEQETTNLTNREVGEEGKKRIGLVGPMSSYNDQMTFPRSELAEEPTALVLAVKNRG